MKLEFKTYTINEETHLWETICKNVNSNPVNRFIIVGEDKKTGNLLIHNNDILAIADIKITETAFTVKKEDLTLIPFEYAEYDIPRKNLTMKIIEDIQRLNEDD